MPTVLRIKGYRIAFFSADGDEPPHVHVAKDDRTAKFWLEPVTLAENIGYRRHELQEISRIIDEHREQLLTAWHEYFG